MEEHEVLIGLGANLGDPIDQLRSAVRLLGEALGPVATSGVYRTEPVGFRDQPEFFNLVCRAEVPDSPESILELARSIEASLGRRRSFRNAPRLIDVDLLDHGGRVMDAPDLRLPHPRLHERAFVLVPLAEVAPEWRHPVLGGTAAELLASRSDWERVVRWGDLT